MVQSGAELMLFLARRRLSIFTRCFTVMPVTTAVMTVTIAVMTVNRAVMDGPTCAGFAGEDHEVGGQQLTVRAGFRALPMHPPVQPAAN